MDVASDTFRPSAREGEWCCWRCPANPVRRTLDPVEHDTPLELGRVAHRWLWTGCGRTTGLARSRPQGPRTTCSEPAVRAAITAVTRSNALHARGWNKVCRPSRQVVVASAERPRALRTHSCPQHPPFQWSLPGALCALTRGNPSASREAPDAGPLADRRQRSPTLARRPREVRCGQPHVPCAAHTCRVASPWATSTLPSIP